MPFHPGTMRRFAVAALLAALTVSGCTLDLPTDGAAASALPMRIAVAERSIVVAGPQGYCIDRPAARDGPGGAFVLLGSCAAIAGTAAAGQPVAPAVLTASVSAAGAQAVAPQLPALNDYFRSAAGRAALSRSGWAATVAVQRAWANGGVFFLAASDASGARGQRVQPEFWRAVFDLKGRIVTLNVTGLQTRPLGPEAGRATLEAFVRQVQRENR